MPKKRVYVESSVISYLTARPAKKPIPRLRQLATAAWWEQRQRWDLFVSITVMREIRDGDPEAARKRLAKAIELPMVPETVEAGILADHLLGVGAIPEKAVNDAIHVAVAAVCNVDYILTWNMRHLYNPDRVGMLYNEIRGMGYKPPVLIRPDDLMETYDDS